MGEQRGTRVYVGNLTDKVKKDDLECEFTKYGKLNSVWIAFNPPGFAFIEFEHRDDAEKACDVLNGSELLGSQLRVEISKGRPRQGGRRGGGGFRSDRRGSGGRDYGRRDYGSSGYRRDSGSSSGGRYRDRGYGGGGSGRSNYGSSGRSNYGASSGRSNYGGRDGFSKMKNTRNPEDRGYSSGGGGGSGRYRSRSPANHRF